MENAKQDLLALLTRLSEEALTEKKRIEQWDQTDVNSIYNLSLVGARAAVAAGRFEESRRRQILARTSDKNS